MGAGRRRRWNKEEREEQEGVRNGRKRKKEGKWEEGEREKGERKLRCKSRSAKLSIQFYKNKFALYEEAETLSGLYLGEILPKWKQLLLLSPSPTHTYTNTFFSSLYWQPELSMLWTDLKERVPGVLPHVIQMHIISRRVMCRPFFVFALRSRVCLIGFISQEPANYSFLFLCLLASS